MTTTKTKKAQKQLAFPAPKDNTPITLRFPDKAIEQLKDRARKMSVEKNEDISYVDLIRNATSIAYGIDADDSFDQVAELVDRDNETRGFWTAEKIEEFEASPTGIMLQECIDSGDYAPFVSLYREKLKYCVHKRSLTLKLLQKTEGLNGLCIIYRDLASVAFVIKRRGAVPDQIMEGEEILVPTFEIAAHPTIRMCELRPHMLFDVMVKPCIAIQRELDTNTLSALGAAADSRKDQVVEVTYLSPENIQTCFKNLVQHDLVPNAIVMHPKQYLNLLTFGKDYVNAPPMREAFLKRQFGSIAGVDILVSTRCHFDTIHVVAQPHEVGVLFMPSETKVRHSSDSAKLRETFVASMNCGICITNDYAISVIQINSK